MNKPQTITEDMTAAKPAKRRRDSKKTKRWVAMLSIPLILIGIGLYWWITSGATVETDNAAVKQDIVSVSALVNGPISGVDVKNGDQVRRGDVLFRIDPAPFQVALEQAEAQLAAARLQTSQLRTQAAGTGADISGSAAELEIKRNALARQQALLKRGFTTRADYEDALAEVRVAETALADARARAANANAAIAPGEQPSIAQAQAAVDKARLDLSRTVVRAPMDGVVANADRLQIGQMAAQGLGMLSLVHGKDAWVEANFKEKDVGKIAPGQKVRIEIDAYPGVDFTGHVESVGAGTGSEFAILPAQNANGNWVKVSQRVPVRIAIDGNPKKPLIAGLSATATVSLRD
ncbi:HlyD family secretion protein [Sphingomonas sp. HDW15A]|uniref:HlyD family secretion protein n=1 Tax=Sphingomonas sp. HDW15A TaxID=2714942 RepID=UPI00140891A9|nr:HlyD family secretion protein [Sphingomonas sp. HDW15A]QIK95531.1 HlyD family secretion protein [Sphingomonas sp. HDW15A]